MVPRADIIAVDINEGSENIIKKMTTAGHSRLPVFNGALDKVLGVVHIKDITSKIAKNKKVRIVGRVSMDLITVDLTRFKKIKVTEKDYIELINSKNNIDYLSKIIKTIPYEILTSLGKRYQRRYIA